MFSYLLSFENGTGYLLVSETLKLIKNEMSKNFPWHLKPIMPVMKTAKESVDAIQVSVLGSFYFLLMVMFFSC